MGVAPKPHLSRGSLRGAFPVGSIYKSYILGQPFGLSKREAKKFKPNPREPPKLNNKKIKITRNPINNKINNLATAPPNPCSP